MSLTTPAADARSHEILASIRQAFAEKGFDGASMQDLALSLIHISEPTRPY